VSQLDTFMGSLSPRKQHYALKVASLLQDVFTDLRRQGYLRNSLRGRTERANFVSILRDSDNLFDSFNMLFRIRENVSLKEFVGHNKKFGVSEKGMAYLVLSESVSTFQRYVELFKNCFLFILKSGRGFSSRMTLGTFLRKLVALTGTKGKAIADEVDVDLRNSLAHGLFWMEQLEVVYCKDITLRDRERIGLEELWMKARKQSILSQCLIKLIVDWFAGT